MLWEENLRDERGGQILMREKIDFKYRMKEKDKNTVGKRFAK